MIKKKHILLCSVYFFVIILISFGCTSYKTYANTEAGYSFKLPQKENVTENNDGITAALSDKVTVAVFSNSVLEYADSYYLSFLKKNQLNLHSGAFEASYNNTLYISKLMEYLFSDSTKGYSVYGIHQIPFNKYDSWCASILSEQDDVNGSIYICVENARSYVICIYIKDSYENRHKYDQIINRFIESFQIKI